MLLIRAHELGCIMTEPKSKTEALSVGAKTHIKKLAREYVYGFKDSVSSKYMEKGILVEDDSIALYNSVFKTDYVKNTERKTNQWVTGECDVNAPDRIIDVKSSWSLSTFPCVSEDAVDKLYEWQGRAYMMLWNKDLFENAFCMVSTPEHLIKYEPIDQHIVDGIDEKMRVTVVQYERDLDIEENIKVKVTACQNYFNEMLDKIANDHNH